MSRLQGVLYSVFTTRIIINIRSAGRRRTGESTTELHHGYDETESATQPMTFRPGVGWKGDSDPAWTQTMKPREMCGGNASPEMVYIHDQQLAM